MRYLYNDDDDDKSERQYYFGGPLPSTLPGGDITSFRQAGEKRRGRILRTAAPSTYNLVYLDFLRILPDFTIQSLDLISPHCRES